MPLDSPIWPAQLDHFRIDAPDPAENTDVVFIAGLQANF